MHHLIDFIFFAVIGTLVRIIVRLMTHGLPGWIVLGMLVFVILFCANIGRRA